MIIQTVAQLYYFLHFGMYQFKGLDFRGGPNSPRSLVINFRNLRIQLRSGASSKQGCDGCPVSFMGKPRACVVLPMETPQDSFA